MTSVDASYQSSALNQARMFAAAVDDWSDSTRRIASRRRHFKTQQSFFDYSSSWLIEGIEKQLLHVSEA